jgi:hypothetical protein
MACEIMIFASSQSETALATLIHQRRLTPRRKTTYRGENRPGKDDRLATKPGIRTQSAMRQNSCTAAKNRIIRLFERDVMAVAAQRSMPMNSLSQTA